MLGGKLSTVLICKKLLYFEDDAVYVRRRK